MNVSSFLFEIRYAATPSMLDRRGQIAQELAGPELPNWTIAIDKVELANMESKNMFAVVAPAFLLFAMQATEHATFKSAAVSFLGKAWSLIPHQHISRIGVRSKFLRAVDDHDQLLKSYRERFLAFSDDDVAAMNAELVDLGMPLNFACDSYSFNTQSGPMKAEQSVSAMSVTNAPLSTDQVPANGFHLDLDYFAHYTSRSLSQREVKEFIAAGLNKANDVNDQFITWLEL